MSTKEKADEVNLSYISKSIERRFKNLLKIGISVFLFYKRKWLLFLVLLIIGAITGYFLDSGLGFSKKYTQEIIIEPKYDTKEYIYDVVTSLKTKIKDSQFLEKIKLDSNSVKNLLQVEIAPIIRATDVLDNLHEKYGDKEYFYRIIESYDAQTLEDIRYQNFYKYHRLVFHFRDKDSENEIISMNILSYIRSNEYYQKILTQTIKQTEINLKKNKKTVEYIDAYLDKLTKLPLENDDELIVVGKESEIPTVSTLLTRKQNLLNTISTQEDELILNDELFDIVEKGDIFLSKITLFQKMKILIPIILFLAVSIIFLFKELPSRLERYINS